MRYVLRILLLVATNEHASGSINRHFVLESTTVEQSERRTINLAVWAGTFDTAIICVRSDNRLL